MVEIKEYNKCNNCIHIRVCNYAENRQELLKTMNEQLTSWCGTDYFLPSFFDFSFECKEFIKQEPITKNAIWPDKI